jgi:hypothetical protein
MAAIKQKKLYPPNFTEITERRRKNFGEQENN